jgi:hypothetical protein
MGIVFTVSIVVAIIIYIYNLGNQQINQTVLTYAYLDILLYTCNNKEEFEKLLLVAYSFDSNSLPFDNFNRKWETICKAARIQPYKRDFGGVSCISESVIPLITANIYDNPINKERIRKMNQNFPKSMSIEVLQKIARGNQLSSY